MSGLDLAAIRARVQEATEGPWTAWNRGVGFEVHADTEWGERAIFGHVHDDCATQQDADFVAHARADVPALLSALDAVTLERELWRETALHHQEVADEYREHAAAMVGQRDAARAALRRVKRG